MTRNSTTEPGKQKETADERLCREWRERHERICKELLMKDYTENWEY